MKTLPPHGQARPGGHRSLEQDRTAETRRTPSATGTCWNGNDPRRGTITAPVTIRIRYHGKPDRTNVDDALGQQHGGVHVGAGGVEPTTHDRADGLRCRAGAVVAVGAGGLKRRHRFLYSRGSDSPKPGRLAVERPEILKREIRALVFDQYGTIVDMQQGLTEIAAPFLRKKGWSGEAHSFVTWWRRTHFENSMIDALCDRGHTPYRQIGHRAVSHVMDRCGIAYTQDEVRWLVAEIEKLKPFPDVVAALERLRGAGYKLVILSNGDRDMLEAAGPHIGFPFDRVISVQEAGYFKPHWKTYAKAEELIGVDRSACLFVANHAFDCIGAKSYGMRTAFVDRRKRPFGETPHQPDLIVADFAELAATLA